jgi:acyl-CoA synthetase (AMP-forming)/AMP-acid ligase II
VALIHSLLAAGVPFALFPASPTPYELKHLVKVSKVKTIFTSPRNLENARIAAKEAKFPESDGIFILQGKVEGKRSFDDLVCSVKEPAKDYAKPVDADALACLIFSSGTTGPPKGETFCKAHALSHSYSPCWVARCHDITQESRVLSDAGARRGDSNQSGPAGRFLHEPDFAAFRLTSVAGFSPQPPRSTGLPVALVAAPFYHSFGLSVFCFRPFGAPCTLIIMPKWDVKLTLKLIPKCVRFLDCMVSFLL